MFRTDGHIVTEVLAFSKKTLLRYAISVTCVRYAHPYTARWLGTRMVTLRAEWVELRENIRRQRRLQPGFEPSTRCSTVRHVEAVLCLSAASVQCRTPSHTTGSSSIITSECLRAYRTLQGGTKCAILQSGHPEGRCRNNPLDFYSRGTHIKMSDTAICKQKFMAQWKFCTSVKRCDI